MLTLSLLLGAAAGVNAILGGEVSGVKIAEGKYICANDCAYEGAYFGQAGFYCPVEEAIARLQPDGTDENPPRYQCTGDWLPDGYTERPRRDGEEPTKCDTVDRENVCVSFRDIGGLQNSKTIDWTEVAAELKEAKSQDGQSSPGQSVPEKSVPEKPVKNCAVEGSVAFQKCQKESNPSFDKCNEQGLAAIEECRQQ